MLSSPCICEMLEKAGAQPEAVKPWHRFSWLCYTSLFINLPFMKIHKNVIKCICLRIPMSKRRARCQPHSWLLSLHWAKRSGMCQPIWSFRPSPQKNIENMKSLIYLWVHQIATDLGVRNPEEWGRHFFLLFLWKSSFMVSSYPVCAEHERLILH